MVAGASVLVVALADDGPGGDQARARIRGEHIALPELTDLEVRSPPYDPAEVLDRRGDGAAGCLRPRQAHKALHVQRVRPATGYATPLCAQIGLAHSHPHHPGVLYSDWTCQASIQ
jgi:hypothetical protein